MRPASRRDKHMALNLSADEMAVLVRLADEYGLNKSAFLRYLLKREDKKSTRRRERQKLADN